MKKSTWINFAIVIVVIALAIILMNLPKVPQVSKELAECIGENSVVYSQIGCHACETQEDMFGDNFKYINHFVCNDNWATCQEKLIIGTPSWEINSQIYRGVQSIETLKDLTGCN